MEESSITCLACQAKNTLHSKYCANCGSRLPAASHIVCPNCQAANSADRYYCDECGTRLHEEGGMGSQELSPDETISTNASAFRLPAREPGDTGDLDPSSLVDRLKRDELSPDAKAGLDEAVPLPDASEVLERKPSTADLPEWLVEEYDSDPIIDAPRPISADAYLEMIGEADRADGADVDPAGLMDDLADLPSWLADADDDRQWEAPREDQPDLTEDLSSWLAELSETADMEPAEPAEPFTDWLTELGPANTDLLSRPKDSGAAQSGSLETEEDDLPDWLGELGPPDTNLLSAPGQPTTAPAEPDSAESDEPLDWMSDLGTPDTEFLSTPVSATLVGQEEGELEDELPEEWLEEFDRPDTSFLALKPDTPAESAEAEVIEDEVASDWLAELGPPSTDMLASRPASESFLSANSEEEDQESLDWMSELGPPDTDYLKESSGLSQGEAAEPEWLDEVSEPTMPERVTDEEPTDFASADETLGEAIDAGGFFAEGFADDGIEDEELLPTWLSDYDDAEMALQGEQSAELDEGGVVELEELSGWLYEVDQLEQMIPGELGDDDKEAEPTGAFSQEEAEPHLALEAEQPEWEGLEDAALEDVTGTQEEETGAPDGLPAWLAAAEAPEETPEKKAQTFDEPPPLDEDAPDAYGELWALAGDETPSEALESEELPVDAPQTVDGIEDLAFDTGEPDAFEPEAEQLEVISQAPESRDDTVEPEQEFLPDEIESVEGVESIADLLADIGATGLLDAPELSGDALGDLFEDEELAQETELEWMTAPLVLPAGFEDPQGELELAGEGSEQAGEPEEEAQADSEEALEEADATLLEEPDWLSELASIGLDAAFSDDTSDRDETQPEVGSESGLELAGESPAGAVEPIGAEPQQSEEAAEPQLESTAADSLAAEGVLREDPGQSEATPDWLSELGPPTAGQTADIADIEELVSSGDLPEWVAELKPEMDSESESHLPSAISEGPDEDEALPELEDESRGADLPDWLLSDAEKESSAILEKLTSLTVEEIAEQLEGESEARLPAGEPATASSEWGDVLSALPPSRRPDEDLVRAEIPDWLQQLRPSDVEDDGALVEMKLPAVVSGPLAGLRGVIGIEPIIDLPHTGGNVATFAVTKEQQQQAALLRRLTQWEIRPSVVPVQRSVGPPAWLRAVLFVVLFMVILLGLSVPDLLPTERAPLSEQTVAVEEAIQAVAGKSVLVALDYTPALSGELTPLAQVLLARLEQNDSPIITLSQSAAGAAIAATLMSERDGVELGYAPGEAIALRQLAGCLGPDGSCTQLFGRELSTDQQAALQDVALVVVVTGDRDSLVPWIEQVAAASGVPVLAGITQSLAPIAEPYAAAGQLHGLLASLEATVAYQDAYLADEAVDSLSDHLGALQITQLLAAVILVVGAIIYGITSGSRERSSAKGDAT